MVLVVVLEVLEQVFQWHLRKNFQKYLIKNKDKTKWFKNYSISKPFSKTVLVFQLVLNPSLFKDFYLLKELNRREVNEYRIFNKCVFCYIWK